MLLKLGHGIQLVSMMHHKPVEFDEETNFFPINPVSTIYFKLSPLCTRITV